MNKYEVMYVIDTALEDSARAELVNHFSGLVAANGGEGVMINLNDAPYAFRRTDSLLKLKPIHDVDLEIVSVKPGTGRNAGTAGALVVDYKGTHVGVSSGLTAQLRQEIYDNPAAYIGRVIKVQYAEESVSKSGKVSLRFPRFIELCDPDKTVSYA